MQRILAIMLTLVVFLAACATPPSATSPSAAPDTPASNAPATDSPASETADTGSEPQHVKIGLILSRSGATSANATAAQMGFDGYLEYFEELGGFQNKPDLEVEWVFGDSESTPEGAVSAFEAMVNIEKVDAIIGTGRGIETGPCVPLAIKYQIPFVLLYTVADTMVNTPNDYVFRPTPGDVQQKVDMYNTWDMLSERQGGIKTAAFIVSADDYGITNADIYREICASRGVEVLFEEVIQAGTTDMSGAINRVKSTNPDIVVAAFQVNEGLIFQRQVRDYRMETPIVCRGGGYLDASFVPAADGTAHGVVAHAFWGQDALNYLPEEAKTVGEAIMAKGPLDIMNDLTISGWMTAGVMLDALDRAETLDSAGIAAALAATDMPKEHPANLFTQYTGISFGSDPDGTQYNQNQQSTTAALQLQNDVWKVVYPSSIVPDDENTLVWPSVPSWK